MMARQSGQPDDELRSAYARRRFSYIIGRDDPAAPLHEPLVRIFAFAPCVIPQLIHTGAAVADCLERLREDARR